MRKKSKSISPTPRGPAPAPGSFSHDDIAACAKAIWEEKGRPTGRDVEIWHEAERRLRDRVPTSEREVRAFANPEVPFDEDNQPTGELESRLAREASAPGDRSATSL